MNEMGGTNFDEHISLNKNPQGREGEEITVKTMERKKKRMVGRYGRIHGQ